MSSPPAEAAVAACAASSPAPDPRHNAACRPVQAAPVRKGITQPVRHRAIRAVVCGTEPDDPHPPAPPPAPQPEGRP